MLRILGPTVLRTVNHHQIVVQLSPTPLLLRCVAREAGHKVQREWGGGQLQHDLGRFFCTQLRLFGSGTHFWGLDNYSGPKNGGITHIFRR